MSVHEAAYVRVKLLNIKSQNKSDVPHFYSTQLGCFFIAKKLGKQSKID